MLVFLTKFKIVLAAVLLSFFASSAEATVCHGRMFNPISDPNWINGLPIKVFGRTLFPGPAQSKRITQASNCLCPSKLGVVLPGIVTTYWTPKYIIETERSPGCLSTLGGLRILPGFQSLSAEQEGGQGSPTKSGQVNRMQTHWYEYPLFSILDIAAEFICDNPSGGFDLAYLSEIDPTLQNEALAVLLSPEAVLFSTPVAQFVGCAVDGVAATVAEPLDEIVWCAGTWGPMYPLSSVTPHHLSNPSSNMLTAAKFIARQHRVGQLFTTIGPLAICSPHLSPYMPKSQYRWDRIWPLNHRGDPVSTGESEFTHSVIPPSNYPVRGESAAYLMWVARQCCFQFGL